MYLAAQQPLPPLQQCMLVWPAGAWISSSPSSWKPCLPYVLLPLVPDPGLTVYQTLTPLMSKRMDTGQGSRANSLQAVRCFM